MKRSVYIFGICWKLKIVEKLQRRIDTKDNDGNEFDAQNVRIV